MIEEALIHSGIIRSVVLNKDFNSLHKFLRGLFDSGVISRDVYSSLLDELSELVLLDGDEFRRRAKEFAEKVESIISNRVKSRKPKSVLQLIMEEDFSGVHRFLRGLFDSGVISRDVYSSLLDELSELVLLDGDEFRRRAKEFAEKVEKYAVL